MTHIGAKLLTQWTQKIFLEAVSWVHIGSDVSYKGAHMGVPVCNLSVCSVHGHMLGLLGEMRGDQLPMLVRFDKDPTQNFMHALALEDVTVPTDVLVDGYFATPMATYLMS